PFAALIIHRDLGIVDARNVGLNCAVRDQLFVFRTERDLAFGQLLTGRELQPDGAAGLEFRIEGQIDLGFGDFESRYRLLPSQFGFVNSDFESEAFRPEVEFQIRQKLRRWMNYTASG